MKYFQPTYNYSSVVDIDLNLWWDQGLRGLILDVDDTLTPKNSALISEAVLEWLAKVSEQGFKTYIVSNNRYPEHIERISKRLDIPAIAKAGKPFSASFIQALEYMALDAAQVVAIGDRVLTDITGAVHLGLKSCLVDPVTRRPSFTKRCIYAFEKQLMNL